MRDIACGRAEFDLIGFASKVNAAEMKEWPKLGLYDAGFEGWGPAFEQAVTRTLAAGKRIHFNLTGLDIADALAGDRNFWSGRFTAYELQQIVTRSTWFAATIFYLDGRVLSESELMAIGISAPGSNLD